MTTTLALLTAALAAGQAHDAANPLYRELRAEGVAVGAAGRVKLPEPWMADGLDAGQQEAVLKKLTGDDYTVEDFVRRSQVAPQILRIRSEVAPSDPQAPTRGVDLAFVAYGDLKAVADKAFLERLLAANNRDGKGQELKPADLAKRGIAVQPGNGRHESYGTASFVFLDKVHLDVTGRQFWSEAPDSLVVAARIEPRFTADKEFPNRWRPLRRDDDGAVTKGAPEPYEAAGYYMKITRLKEPTGALLFEAHVIFTEPVKWFDGVNQLRSKLPAAIQGQVRAMRRELQKASR
jgi:hypothetical protein